MDDFQLPDELAAVEGDELPSLAELIARGDAARRSVHATIEESRQQRQTLLYIVASTKRAAQAIRHSPPECDNPPTT